MQRAPQNPCAVAVIAKSIILITGATLVIGLTACGGGNGNSGGGAGGQTSPLGEWAWMTGSNINNQDGVYGIQGTPSAGNTPGARTAPFAFTDPSGNLWLLGGFSTCLSFQGDLNDLWRYSNGQWTWIGGSNSIEAKGVYGTKGVAAPVNWPGARYLGVSWTDSSGNFWIFGGLGIDSAGTRGTMNDLWKYSNGEWTWMSGSNIGFNGGITAPIPGVYGVKGIAAPGNVPGDRTGAVSWADAAGNLWLFGGEGDDAKGNTGILNDLWKFSNGEWTWMSGSDTANQLGSYGSLGVAAQGNVPGARTDSVTWTDAYGNLWLFGGQGNDANGVKCSSSGGPCLLNDLWKYSNGEWTWMGGSNIVDAVGIYGTQGTSGSKNFPGARRAAVSWFDPAGNLWLFGGDGIDSANLHGNLNDLWKYSGGQWTWMAGSDQSSQTGIYGKQGTPSAGNVPGAREWAVGWTDKSGNLWLFGGIDPLIAYGGDFNDLWEYRP
ncbi:MAG: kelch repeat-containing protein [Terracidiphilus sp.]